MPNTDPNPVTLFREEQKLSQEQFAKVLQLEPQFIADVELGKVEAPEKLWTALDQLYFTQSRNGIRPAYEQWRARHRR